MVIYREKKQNLNILHNWPTQRLIGLPILGFIATPFRVKLELENRAFIGLLAKAILDPFAGGLPSGFVISTSMESTAWLILVGGKTYIKNSSDPKYLAFFQSYFPKCLVSRSLPVIFKSLK